MAFVSDPDDEHPLDARLMNPLLQTYMLLPAVTFVPNSSKSKGRVVVVSVSSPCDPTIRVDSVPS